MFSDFQFWDYFILSLIVLGVVVFAKGFIFSKNRKAK